MRSVLRLEHITVDDRERVGGKGFALATLLTKGFRVPSGLCITVDSYNRFLAETGLGARILMELHHKDGTLISHQSAQRDLAVGVALLLVLFIFRLKQMNSNKR